jgi:hypothetical protein
MLWYVATVDGEILFKERKIQYLNTVSKKTGNVATNKDIKSPFSGKPKCLKSHSKKTSQPRGEWNPTNRSVPKINKKDFVVSLKLYKDSDKKAFKIII